MRMLDVLVKPKASKGKILQLEDGSLVVSVSAPAVNGKANEALIRMVAKWAGVPPSAVSIAKGHRCRRKTLAIDTD